MKFVVLLGLLISHIAMAQDWCVVKSKYRDLESGLNKSTICKDTLVAITGKVTPIKDAKLFVEATGRRAMYSVELNQITYKLGKMRIADTKGTLNWYPGDSYVTLKGTNVRYSEEIILSHRDYNSREFNTVSGIIRNKLATECYNERDTFSVELANRDVDLYVVWDTWILKNRKNEAIGEIEVTFWQHPGQYKLDSIEIYGANCR